MKIVLTNGCFDILHRGHVSYLEKARALGDYLIVAINSDASVRKLKGKGHPINNQADRAFLVLALRCVNEVILFDEDRITNILKDIRPNTYVKGGDYTLKTLNQEEVNAVKKYGGEIKIIPISKGYSTTNTVNKILKYGLRRVSR